MSATQSGRKMFSSYGRLGVLLAVIGAILAIDTMANLSVLYKLWPALCTVLGIGFIGIYLQRSRHEAMYIGVGSFFIGFSALAFYERRARRVIPFLFSGLLPRQSTDS